MALLRNFSDSAILKNAFLEAAGSLFCDYKNKSEIVSAINDLQLSHNTDAKRLDQN